MRWGLLGLLVAAAATLAGFLYGRHLREESLRRAAAERAALKAALPAAPQASPAPPPGELPSDGRQGDSVPRGLQ